MRRNAVQVLILLSVLSLAAGPAAARELRPHVERLENGLTVMLQEDHAQPLLSIQMLYRVGGRTESTGETGLAHFVEHMAFRATENFPDTQVVSRIYEAGGEWHGYTWIDETTYFETMPADRLRGGDRDEDRGPARNPGAGKRARNRPAEPPGRAGPGRRNDGGRRAPDGFLRRDRRFLAGATAVVDTR